MTTKYRRAKHASDAARMAARDHEKNARELRREVELLRRALRMQLLGAHLYLNGCPYPPVDPNSRDPNCPACQALMACDIGPLAVTV